MKLESVRKQIDDYFENTPLEKIQADWNKYADKVTSPKIGFGPEYGINPPDIGIEEFFFVPISADVAFRGHFVIKYRHLETGRTTMSRVSSQALVGSGVLNLDKLKEFLK
jgi:hypothetical protein